MHYIFIHGLGQNSATWDKTTSLLSLDDTIDCPDLWKILNGQDATYTNLYHSFVTYCESLPGRLHICGLSLGAIIALNYAIEYPNRIQSTVLVGAQYKVPKNLMKFQNFIFKVMPEKSFIKMGMPKKNILALTNSMIDLDFSLNLKDVSCPTLLVCGKNDNTNIKATNDLGNRIQNAEMKIIEDAGHEINTEAPQKLADVLNSFWKREK